MVLIIFCRLPFHLIKWRVTIQERKVKHSIQRNMSQDLNSLTFRNMLSISGFQEIT